MVESNADMTNDDIEQFYDEQRQRKDDQPDRGLSLPANEEILPESEPWVGDGSDTLVHGERQPASVTVGSNPIALDYEPEQTYGSAHDLRQHIRFGGSREDY